MNVKSKRNQLTLINSQVIPLALICNELVKSGIRNGQGQRDESWLPEFKAPQLPKRILNRHTPDFDPPKASMSHP